MLLILKNGIKNALLFLTKQTEMIVFILMCPEKTLSLACQHKRFCANTLIWRHSSDQTVVTSHRPMPSCHSVHHEDTQL